MTINQAEDVVLVLNAGSSTLKFAVFQSRSSLVQRCSGVIDRIGSPNASFALKPAVGQQTRRTEILVTNHAGGLDYLLKFLMQELGILSFTAVGHRVVHGGPRYRHPERVDPVMLGELRRFSAFDPEHLPAEIALMEAIGAKFSDVPQIACFDTAFHRDMPRVAKLLPIPRRYDTKGIHRYGFHGLSYAYLMEELVRVGDPAATNGRVILAHLGNGASLAAVRDGKGIDTSMSFTPTAGLPMSTRSGDLDPGLGGYLARTEQMTAAQFQKMVNHESGLLGVSEISSDMRDLLAEEANDVRAAEAVALFCYQAKKWIGSFASALGGLDTLVFAGGIGENAPLIRERICEGLGFLGVELDQNQNAANASVISPSSGRVAVRVIRTDEERIIAESVVRVLDL
ncbi:MAG: acetate/propionate family kinase [Candidatus Udaeobacter sp.]